MDTVRILYGWILYGNMVDFSFIVSLYVSDLPNVTISILVLVYSLATTFIHRPLDFHLY